MDRKVHQTDNFKWTVAKNKCNKEIKMQWPRRILSANSLFHFSSYFSFIWFDLLFLAKSWKILQL